MQRNLSQFALHAKLYALNAVRFWQGRCANMYFLQVVVLTYVLTYVHVPYSLLLSNNYDWKYSTYYLNLLFSI